MKNLTSNETQKDHRENPGRFRHFLAGSLAAAALFSSPLLESTAFAQQPPPPVIAQNDQAQRNLRYDVNGSSSVSLSNGTEGNITAFPVVNQSSVPVVSFEGPAVVTAKFYPIVRAADAQSGASLPVTVTYTVDRNTPVDISSSTAASAVTNQTLTSRGLAIGTPTDLRIEVSGEGPHTVSVSRPDGLLEVVSVIAPAPAVVEPVVQHPIQQPPVTQPPVRTPENPRTRQLDSIRSRLALNYDSYWFHDFGNAGNGGSMHQADILYRHPIGQHLAFFVGPRLTLHDASITSSGNKTSLRIYGAEAMAGLAVYFGESTLYLSGMGGLQAYNGGVEAADGRTSSATNYGAGYGGRLGYDYGDILGISAQLTNNPFNPGIFRLHFEVPYTWIQGDQVRPSLDASLLWLHLMRPTAGDGVGGGSLAENNLFLHAHALVPIWRLGPIVPSALVGFEYDRSLDGAGPADRAAALLGGAVTLDIAHKFRLMAGAGASVPTGSPFVLANANVLDF
jgi:hypothetical protein